MITTADIDGALTIPKELHTSLHLILTVIYEIGVIPIF